MFGKAFVFVCITGMFEKTFDFFISLVGMRKKEIALCFVFAILLAEAEAGIRRSVVRSLNSIKAKMSSVGRNVQKKVDNIKNALDKEKNKEVIDAASGAIDKMAGAVGKLTKSDVLDIISGCMEITSAIASLIPKIGKVVGAVFSMIASILGAIGGGDDIGTIVSREIRKALDDYDDSELRAMAEGTMREYSLSQSYLRAFENGRRMSTHEVATMASHVPVYRGIRFLGKLASKIRWNTQKKSKTQVLRAAEYLQLYAGLAAMRSAIFWEMYSLVRESSHSYRIAHGIKRAAQSEERHDRAFMELLKTPVYRRAVFFAYFNPSQWPVTMKFMSKCGLSYQRLNFLSHGKHYLRPQRWTNWYMKMGGGAAGFMKGTKKLNSQSKFYFDTISSQDNTFYIRSVRWPRWRVIMNGDAHGTCRGWKRRPGSNGRWKVIRFRDGRYMLSPVKWPNWFIYMKNDAWGHIRGWKGDPGIQGHWLIN